MRIAYVLPAYLPARAYGGPVSFVSELAEALVRRGHEATVLTSDLASDRGDRLGPEEESIGGVRVRRFATLLRRRWTGISLEFLAGAGRALGSSDVIHIGGYRDGFGPVAARAARRRGLPVVWEPMGMVPVVGRSRALKRLFDLAVGRRQLRAASALIATSPSERQELIEAGLEAARIVLRPNGIRIPPLPDPEAVAAMRRRLGLVPGDLAVVYLGRLSYRKGLDLLAEAVARLPEDLPVRLLLIGPDERDGTLDGVLGRLGPAAGKRLLAPGPLYGQEKWVALAAADLFALPSAVESFGIAAVEALAMGVPALVSSACGVAAWIAPDCGEVLDRDVSVWARTLLDWARGDRRWDGGRVRDAAGEFDIETIATAQERVYSRVLGEGAPALR